MGSVACRPTSMMVPWTWTLSYFASSGRCPCCDRVRRRGSKPRPKAAPRACWALGDGDLDVAPMGDGKALDLHVLPGLAVVDSLVRNRPAAQGEDRRVGSGRVDGHGVAVEHALGRGVAHDLALEMSRSAGLIRPALQSVSSPPSVLRIVDHQARRRSPRASSGSARTASRVRRTGPCSARRLSAWRAHASWPFVLAIDLDQRRRRRPASSCGCAEQPVMNDQVCVLSREGRRA